MTSPTTKPLRRGLLEQLLMEIEPDSIKSKCDDMVFRLALIYESMKDLRPDAHRRIAHLDSLCEAAMNAQIAVNAHLKQVAEFSSAIDHSGRGSMQNIMIARIVPTHVSRDASLGLDIMGFESPHDDPLTEEPIPQERIELPTLKVIGIMTLCLVAAAFGILTIALGITLWVNRDFFLTWQSWVLLGTGGALYGLLYLSNFKGLLRKYSRNGQWIIVIRWWHWLIYFAISLTAIALVVWSLKLLLA